MKMANEALENKMKSTQDVTNDVGGLTEGVSVKTDQTKRSRPSRMPPLPQLDPKVVKRIENMKKKINRFINTKDIAPWYRGTSIFHIIGANLLFNSIRDDMQQSTSHRVKECLHMLGLDPILSSKKIKLLMKFSRGNDLAFLWFLMELYYKTPKPGPYSVNEQLICSAICHLDMVTTLRELEKILPPGPVVETVTVFPRRMEKVAEVVLPERPQYISPYFERLSIPKEWSKSLNVKRPNFVMDLGIYKIYKDPNYVVPNEKNRWYSNYEFQTSRRLVREILLEEIGRIFRDLKAANLKTSQIRLLCKTHENIRKVEEKFRTDMLDKVRSNCFKRYFGYVKDKNEYRKHWHDLIEQDAEDEFKKFQLKAKHLRQEMALKILTTDSNLIDVTLGEEDIMDYLEMDGTLDGTKNETKATEKCDKDDISICPEEEEDIMKLLGARYGGEGGQMINGGYGGAGNRTRSSKVSSIFSVRNGESFDDNDTLYMYDTSPNNLMKDNISVGNKKGINNTQKKTNNAKKPKAMNKGIPKMGPMNPSKTNMTKGKGQKRPINREIFRRAIRQLIDMLNLDYDYDSDDSRTPSLFTLLHQNTIMKLLGIEPEVQAQPNRYSNMSAFSIEYVKKYDYGYSFSDNGDDTPLTRSQTFFKVPKANAPYNFDYHKIFAPTRKIKRNKDVEKRVRLAFLEALDSDITQLIELERLALSKDELAANNFDRLWKESLNKYELKKQEEAVQDEGPLPKYPRSGVYSGEDKKLMNDMLAEAFAYLRKNPKFVWAQLPHSHKIPWLQDWIAARYGKSYSLGERRRQVSFTMKIFNALYTKSFRATGLTCKELGRNIFTTYNCKDYVLHKAKRLKLAYSDKVNNKIMNHSRIFWFAINSVYAMPRHTFFAYMPWRLRDIKTACLWKSNEYRNNKIVWQMRRNKEIENEQMQ